MYSPSIFCLELLLLQALLIQANPLPDFFKKIKDRGADWFMSASDCSPKQEYNISHQYAIEEPPQLVTGVVCNATYSGKLNYLGVTCAYKLQDAIWEIRLDTL
jgi:hypothetical protein